MRQIANCSAHSVSETWRSIVPKVGLFGALLNAGFAGLLLFLLRGQLGTIRAGELATSD
jgi:hypothetical protein